MDSAEASRRPEAAIEWQRRQRDLRYAAVLRARGWVCYDPAEDNCDGSPATGQRLELNGGE